jgi:cytoskeleton protein RodZ
MVEAIEKNQFGVLGAPVFARGHLRKYAALLGLPVERVQQLYQNLGDRPRDQDPVPTMHRDSGPSIPMSPDSKQRRTLQPSAKWTIVIAAGVLLLAGVVAWVIHTSSKPATTDPVVAPLDTSKESEARQSPVVQTSTAATTNTAVPPTANSQSSNTANSAIGNPIAAERQSLQPAISAAPSTASTQTPPSQTTAARKVRLRFSFTQESWVEVYDARGTRLLYDVGFPGQTRGVDVDPPAQIVLGQAAAVNTEANGRAITVPPRRISNQVARFTVGADGTAQ